MAKNTKAATSKPKQLLFKTYIQMIHNSVGSNMFRNLYLQTDNEGTFDALSDGSNSCAFYVSSILAIFQKISSIHARVDKTVQDLLSSGWKEVERPKIGDILIWEAQKFDDGWHKHIGFYVGGGKAVSTSWVKKTPVIHELHFGKTRRKIEQILTNTTWEETV